MGNRLMSYLTTGVSLDSSEGMKRVSMVLAYCSSTVLALGALLALFPSWPLASAAMAGCLVMAYLARMILPAGNGAGA